MEGISQTFCAVCNVRNTEARHDRGMTDSPTASTEAGTRLLVGTIWNTGGLILAKTVPPERAAALADPGVGASPTWHAFTIDQGGIAFTDRIGGVGDQRMRIDSDAVRVFSDGLAWGPMSFVEQDGTPVPECTRTTLARIEGELAAAGLSALVGHEVEIQLFAEDGAPLGATNWAPYSLAGAVRFEGFIRALYAHAAEVGLELEQVHAEYGLHQLEFSLAPATPVAAADALVLARLIVGRVAREQGLAASLSPRPRAGSAGNGAHQHISLHRDGVPLFGGGDGPHGMSAQGASALAGIVALLPELQGVLAGSILSPGRLAPGMWAGAWATWGLENRETAVRLIAGESPNVEIKIVDPSACGYLATAAVLGAALCGIRTGAPLPPEAPDDPGALTAQERADAGIVQLASVQDEVIERLAGSARLREMLGTELVDAQVAQRRYEHDHYGDLEADELIERFRLAWSV